MTCPEARMRVVLGVLKVLTMQPEPPSPTSSTTAPSGSWRNSAETRLPVEGSLPGA